MPTAKHKHVEAHFGSSAMLRDLVLGMADGLTVPFALAAGLTGAIAASKLVVTAGLAEIAAGTVSMGLGGYLAASGEAAHYRAEHSREHREVVEMPHEEEAEVRAVFRRYGLASEQIAPILAEMHKRPEMWVDFMMRFELGLEKPDEGRAITSAITVGGAYALGGIVPLVPYLLVADARRALSWSIAATLVALFLFGMLRGRLTGGPPVRGAVQTMLVGAIAAAVAFGLARLIA